MNPGWRNRTYFCPNLNLPNCGNDNISTCPVNHYANSVQPYTSMVSNQWYKAIVCGPAGTTGMMENWQSAAHKLIHRSYNVLCRNFMQEAQPFIWLLTLLIDLYLWRQRPQGKDTAFLWSCKAVLLPWFFSYSLIVIPKMYIFVSLSCCYIQKV